VAPAKAIYYPPRKGEKREERVDDLACIHSLDAIVTRNHYGSIVLNAHHALFIDVDVAEEENPPRDTEEYGGRNRVPWQTMFDDLCTVLNNEARIGFRIYRTAAGFRILATTHEFEPDSETVKYLMSSVGADDAFVRLCGAQKTFRARLSPKPWRCGTTRPPNEFPRASAEEEQRFAEWLAHYCRACRNYATCQFLGRIGPAETHARVAPIIELHDRETKAFQSLDLA
jgi:hypothetical protein